ncbi:hypothetical protein SNE40_005976 [Patella caerulea]|uniref:YqaJ viral recombinase domain-containing protein n=1 Tax=Patella caerulea TaxID=87958 RepID=A0AAN8JZE9_PATCE
MAGLGESCTHVSALLFYIEAAVKLHTSKTVTEEKAYWKLPSQFKHVSYEEFKNIDFSSAASLKKTYDTNFANEHTVINSTSKKTTEDLPTIDTPRFANFLKNLSEAPSKPAILSLMPKYSDVYVPEVLQGELPTVLTELFENPSLSSNYKELLDKSYKIKIDVTEQQAKQVEVLTRHQANNRTWFRFRTGRITASRMKSVCHTNPNSPSQSLIQNICYPDVVKFSSVATKWGCDHERHAREMFTSLIQVEHDNVHVRDSGLVISPQYPHIGASPDAIVTCDCCGKSTLEIKCPYCVRDSALSDKETGYLKADQNGNLKLTNTHRYYYQVQTQRLVYVDLSVLFFVVWTEKDIHVEEVLFNKFVWKDIVTKSEHFFRTSILPAIIGKFFSQSRCENDNALVSTSNQHNKHYMYLIIGAIVGTLNMEVW